MNSREWIKPYITKRLPQYSIGFILCLVNAAMSLINPYIGGRMIAIISDGTWRESLKYLLIALIVFTFLRAVIRYLMLGVFERSSQWIVTAMRRDIYDWLGRQSFWFFDRNRVGDIMSRMTGDLEAIRHFCAYSVYGIFENVFIFIAAIILIAMVSGPLLLLIITITPVVIICTLRQSRLLRSLYFDIREHFSVLNSVCEENIGGNRVVKAFAKEDFETKKFDKANQGYYGAHMAAANVWAKYLPVLDFCANLLTVFLCLGGGLMVIYGKLEVWQLVTVSGYLWAVNNPVRQFGWLVNDTQNFYASTVKITNMLSVLFKVKNAENPVKPGLLAGEIDFNNVSFQYGVDDKEPALSDISFHIKAGSTVGIVGKTGSGKSTMMNLLCRYYDTAAGTVSIDGVNVKDFDLHTLRKHISCAYQDVFLFSDTVEGNIAYGVPDAPLEDLIKAAETASADGFIRELTDSYDTIVGERGVGLSGGQKQRLSLARALAANPSILILDDTTSAVDMETEYDIQKALNQYFADRTTFIISHRISSVKNADIILVMEDGRIIEQGNHDTLSQANGVYADLCRVQGMKEKTAVEPAFPRSGV